MGIRMLYLRFMVYLTHIFLTADSTIELHRFANKIGLSRTWFQPGDHPYYEVICPHRVQMIENYIEKLNKRLKEKQ